MAKTNYINIAKKAASTQIIELKKINRVFDKSFLKAVEVISNCKGKVVAAGIGKSGIIARKVSATLSRSRGITPGSMRLFNSPNVFETNLELFFISSISSAVL